MILFPNCKINLGLHILRKREDGFHDLQTIFYPIPLTDALEVVHSNSKEPFQFSWSGNTVTVKAEDNICYKAWQLITNDFELPPLKMHLHKVIPTGAGLGGGSADGAFALILLNKKFNLQLTDEQLSAYALQLGSDCPFFIKNKPCLGEGRGEQLKDISIDLSSFSMVIINPGIHISTPRAFQSIIPNDNRPSLEKIIDLPVEQWKEVLTNDFEEPVFKAYPEIASIKDTLYSSGAIYAAMSGSGSTLYGLFPKNTQPNLQLPDHYFIRHI